MVRWVAGRALGVRPVKLPDLDRPVVPTPDRETSRRELVKDRVELCPCLCDVHRFNQLLGLVSRLRLPDEGVDQIVGDLLAAGRPAAGLPRFRLTDNKYRRSRGRERIKTERAGPKNDGGAWMTRTQAKQSAGASAAGPRLSRAGASLMPGATWTSSAHRRRAAFSVT